MTKQAPKGAERENIMGQTKKISRKATFTVEGKGSKRVFTAVNKRAHTVAKKAGKRTKVSYEALKALKGSGSYKFYAYNAEGELKLIRF